ncbi:MAG: lysophospholipid acyltransferase family protein [Pseudomonadota bacterium]
MSHFSTKDRLRNLLIERASYVGAYAVWMVLQPFPSWWLKRYFAPLGGWLALKIPSFRKRAEDGLIHIWPDMAEERRTEIIRNAGRHFLCQIIEYVHFSRMIARDPIIVNDEGNLRDRLPKTGAILVTAHFGNWEAIRLAARMMGQESGIIYRNFNNRLIDRFAHRTIGAAGQPVLNKGGGLRDLLRHVADGGTVMILVDQRNSGAPFIDFLGKPAETVTIAAEMAARSNVPLVPAIARRDLQGRCFHVTFAPPVPVGEPLKMMEEVNARLSTWIEQYPEQWFWFHRRWRTTSRSRSQSEEESA